MWDSVSKRDIIYIIYIIPSQIYAEGILFFPNSNLEVCQYFGTLILVKSKTATFKVHFIVWLRSFHITFRGSNYFIVMTFWRAEILNCKHFSEYRNLINTSRWWSFSIKNSSTDRFFSKDKAKYWNFLCDIHKISLWTH